MNNIIALLLLSIPLLPRAQLVKLHTDVLVVGGTTGGTAAGIQSARSGAKTIIVEQTVWLGGMLTAAGVSCTDGNAALPSGMWSEFRQALYKHYGTTNLQTGWVSETCFEPHVGDSIFKAWATKEENLRVYYGWYFDKALKTGNAVTGAIFINTKGERLEVEAKITIDGTDLGDVFASAGAAYDLGTEDSSQSREKIAREKAK
jgi:2-polyprenyl-6-methoxyphenol hydroxylase-like FAD-dependent oxidoreductase